MALWAFRMSASCAERSVHRGSAALEGGGQEVGMDGRHGSAIGQGDVIELLRKPGMTAGIFLIGYALCRSFVENFREPDNFTQAATVLTNVAHKAVIGAGKMIKLHDASGNWLYSVASIVVKNGAATVTYTENTDWKWINKDRAVIQVLAGGSIGHGQDLAITITPVAVTGRRLIRPQTNAKAIRGRAMLVWSRNANAEQTVREFDCSISPTAAAFNDADYSSFTLQAKVLSDITDTTYPAGLLLQFVGTLPTPATP